MHIIHEKGSACPLADGNVFPAIAMAMLDKDRSPLTFVQGIKHCDDPTFLLLSTLYTRMMIIGTDPDRIVAFFFSSVRHD